MASLGWLGQTHAFANSPPEHYVGTAYNNAGRTLYTESHWVSEALGQRELVVLFQCPDGAPFARKQVRETGPPHAPSFDLEDARTGFEEGVRDRGASREVFFRSAEGQPEKSAALESVRDLVIDAGLDGFIRKHWDGLATGSRQHVDFLVPSRLRAYPFTLTLMEEALMDAKPVRRFQLALDTWYAFAIPPIILTYTTGTKKIRQYQGLANVRDHDGKSLSVRIDYAAPTHASVTDPKSMLEARSARLDGRCIL
jgi:hypothetical protein